MAVSQAYIYIGIVFVILPHLNLGLLSDYKICGDSECESLMSRVQAIRDHHGKDCRFLSFRRGDTIFVYHKLTGKREDLWAGSIDKQFGYFPKEAVKEEQVYATVEKIVETQKSDFFCMDDFGYPIDSSDFETGDDDVNVQKIPVQESETTQTSPYTDDTNAGSPSTSEDASTESPVSGQESDGASTEENQNKNDGDDAAGTHEEAHETPAALNEQGGSPSSSWLSSSVTGWLGLAKEEEPGNLNEGEKKDEIKETQAEDSFTSSVTGWLGLGGEGNPDDAKDSVNSQEEDRETDDSFTSTMTGWLGFGGEKKTDYHAEEEHNEEIETDEEKQPAEKFRSRRLSLDLDQLQGEEKKEELGTLGWLGNGLSSTLGFGLTNQESGDETTAGRREAEEIRKEEEEQPASNSWLDLGITDILGFRKDKNEVVETTRSDFKETEEDKTLEQPTDSQNMDTSQSQPALTDEVNTEPSLERLEEKVVTETETVLEEEGDSIISSSNKDTTETQQDQNIPSETETQSGNTASVKYQIGSKEEEEGQILDGNKNEQNVVDEEKKTEIEGKDHQMPESVGDEVNGREVEIKTASDIDQDFVPQNDITTGSVFSSEDLKSNFMGQSVSETEELKKDQLQDEKTESVNETMIKQIDNREESSEMSVEIGSSGDDHKGEGSNEETDVLHREIPTTQSVESAEQSQVSDGAEDSSGGSLPFLSSDTAEDKNEPSEDDSLIVDHSAISDNNTEKETHHVELGQGGEAQSVESSSPEFGSSHATNRSAEMHEQASEENRGTVSSGEITPNQNTNTDKIDLASVSPQMQKMATKSEGDADELKETENNLQPAQDEKETLDFKKDFMMESERKSETEAETEGESKEEEKQKEIEELKDEETQEELKEVEEIKEEEKHEKTQELKENEKQEEIEEEEQEKTQELKENEKQEEIEELKEEEKQEKTQELKENEKQEEIEEEEQEKTQELKENEKQEEIEELKEEEKQEKTQELKENEKQEEIEELQEEEEQEKTQELKGNEKQEEMEELQEEEEQEKTQELKGNEKQEEMEELQEEEKQKIEVLKDDEKQEEIEELKEEEEQEKTQELKENEKQEEMEELQEEEKQKIEVLKDDEKQEEIEELKEKEKQEVKEQENHEAVDELKRDEKQEEVEELKKDEKWEGVEELKEEMKQEEVGGLSEEEKQQEVEEIQEEKEEEVVDELKEEEKPVEGLREEGKKEAVEGLKKEDKQEELKEEEMQEDLEEVEKGLHSSPHNQNDIGNEKETQDENNLESVFSEAEERREGESQKEEKQDAVEEGKEEEKKEAEVKQQAKDAENETRSKEEEESLKSVQDEGQDSEEGSSSAYEGTIQTGKHDSGQILSARTEESEIISFESDKDRMQKEEKIKKEKDDATAAVRGKEQEEMKSNEENEHIGSNSANSIPDLYFEVEHKREIEHTDNEVPYSGENDKKRPNESLDRLYSGETKNADVCNDVDVKCSDETSTTEKITEQIHSDDHNKRIAEAESGGTFGLFKNTFSFFGKAPVTEIKESTEPALSLDPNTDETSQPQASLTPEQQPDSTTTTSHLHPDSPAFPEIQPSSLSQTQTSSHPSSLSPNTEAPLKPKTPSKHYKTLLAHMSADEMTILVELFGRHKLQFLDYILGRSEPVTEDLDDDRSILLDIETLLHHQREILFAPSLRLEDAPQEDKEKTRMLVTLQKLEMLLERVRETFNTGKSNTGKANHQAEASCVGASCSTHSKDQEMTTGNESGKTGGSSVGDEGMEERDEKDGRLSGGTGKEKETDKRGGKEERVSPEEMGNKVSHDQPGSLQTLEGVMKQILDFVRQSVEDSSTHVRAARELLIWLTVQVVSSLPDDIRPGPDLYGVPWEPVIISSVVGLVTMLLFSCRCYSSVKSRIYRSKERWMAEQVAQLLDEKCKVLDTLSKCQQEYDELETSLRDSGVLAQTQKTEHLEVKASQLVQAKRELESDLDQLKDQLDQQREHRIEQERRIAVLEESMKTCEEETKDLQSHEEQAQTTLKVYSMNSDRLQRNLETAGEENALQQERNAQLRQQVEGWAERVSELEEEMRRCEVAYSGMVQDVANKDERIMSLTDRLLRMKGWDSDLEEEGGEEGGEETSNGTAGKGEENGRGDDSQGHLQKVQKLIYAAKLNADLKSVDEDKDRVFAKLNDEVKAKEDLAVSIKELEDEKLSLQSESEHYSDQVQRLQQKLNIMTEMYQENELKLHRLLTVEEKERLQKEEKLNKADKNIALAMEELHNYRHRAEEMEEELDKTKQSYQTQISAHEKKAHNNWLAARAAERDLSDIRRQNALLRQKLTDTQFKMDALDKDPYALDSLARPLPFRAERSPYGPSPLGRPASETRAFLSPPTLMEGPPARLSPRVSRGPVEPLGQGEMERSGGPHSDSGSISPTWERDRRGPPPGPPGPLGPPGYMFPESGGPMYRRPVPPPGAMGILPPPGSLPLGPPLPHSRGLPPAGPPGPLHPADMADGAYRENSLGPGELDHRESGPSDRRTPPEADPRMGGVPPPGPPMGPMDGPFPRRAPYGPPPPDFYPPRGPGGPPKMPMWAPPPPGMMFPPRFPPGGPPHPHMPSYGPPMRLPPPDGLPPLSMGPPPPQQPLPSLPHSQSPEDTPSPQDVI